MFANWKTFVVGSFIASAIGLLFISDAAGQFIMPPRNAGNPPPGKTQPGYGQPGTMQRGTGQQTRPTGAKSNETYCIVEVGKDLQIVSKPSGLKDLKKQLDDRYKTANKTYQDAKKDKNNKGVTLEKPDKKDYTVVERKSGFKTQEDAQKELEKMQADRDKGGKKSAR
jgi:hypothetical protein